MPIDVLLSPAMLYSMAAAACVALAAAGVLALGRARARAASDALERLAQELAALRRENGSQAATLVALAGRFDALQRQLSADARFAGQGPAPAAASAFELAIRLARSGATVEDLVSACMMSRHEAELALRLHGPGSRGTPARMAAVR